MKRKTKKRILAIVLTIMMVITSFVSGIGTQHAEAASITADYKQLLKCALKFYDANMCGYVNGKTQCSYRHNCHTSDGIPGGYHDAGDHVKFGITEAYSMFVLEMSYDTDKGAYQAAGETGHHRVITEHFADYLYRCAVLNGAGNVSKYAVQVGDGNSDHSYWGSPEAQTTTRLVTYSSSSNPSTDIVPLSAAALALHYKNYGDAKYLDMAKKLFAYAKSMPKKAGTAAANGNFYNETSWDDDYCLAALILYQITGNSSYRAEYNNNGGDNKASYTGWHMCWDDVKGAISYYARKSSGLRKIVTDAQNTKRSDGYCCPLQWGSARYNTSAQYSGLLYDRITGTKTYQSWADGQMKILLGNNSSNRCFVVGYNQYSVKYPHHRAASGYDWNGFNRNAPQKYVLTGALVGGPKGAVSNYTDSVADYVCNEVAIDYNATLVAAAAALYTATGGAVTSAGSTPGEISSNGTNTELSQDSSGTRGVIAGGGSERSSVNIRYTTHVQNIGWQGEVNNGSVAGTSGRALRLEGIKINLSTAPSQLGIQYTTHVQNIGWQPWSANGEMSGTEGLALRLEAIKIQLTGSDKDKYDVYYRVHAQNIGWMAWAKNGAAAGTAGRALRLEAIEIMVVDKGKTPASRSFATDRCFSKVGSSNENIGGADSLHVGYMTHVQNIGWQQEYYDGGMAGTSGRSLRLEGIKIRVMNKPNGVGGGIEYSTHVQNIGWQPFCHDGNMAGTSGRALRLEAIKIRLTGDLANYYDVYYRVHAQNVGWMSWTKNGESAGTAGYAYRLEGIQIVVVNKGAGQPAGNYAGINSNTQHAFIGR